MADFEVKFSGFPGTLGEIAKNPGKAKEVVSDALVEFGETVSTTLKGSIDSFTPVKEGTLKAGNTVTAQVVNGGLLVTYENLVEYASFVNDGTNHMSGRFFVQQGFSKAQNDIEQAANKAAQNIADKLNG